MSKMIDLRKSTVKYAKTQDRPIYKHCHTFKPIDNRWVWGMCMVKWKGGQLSEPVSLGGISVFMTTLGVAPTQTGTTNSGVTGPGFPKGIEHQPQTRSQ